MSFRIIYLSIRATQYTDRATRAVGRNISKLIKEQQALQRQMVMNFAAGVMFTAMSAMVAMGIGGMIASTREGRRVMRYFERSVQSLTKALGEQFLVVLGPLIRAVTNLLNVISKNEPLMRLIAIVSIGITVLMAMKGITFLLAAAHSYLKLSILTTTSVMQGFIVHGGYATTMMWSWSAAAQVLQASLAPMIMSFMLFLSIAERLGPMARPILGVAAALMILAGAYIAIRAALGDMTALANLGVMVAAAGAGMGMAAAVYEQPTYQYGTRLVQRTTPAIVHAGDVITRPDRGDVTPQQREGGFPRSYYDITLSTGDIKTKADKEELRPFILKALKDALNNKV